MSAHDFNLVGENAVFCSTFLRTRGLHVHRPVDLCAVDGVRSPTRIDRLRAALSRRLSVARLHLPRPGFLHGVCPTDVPRELAGHRNLLAFGPVETVPRWVSFARFAEYAGRRQSSTRLADLLRLGPTADHAGTSVVCRRTLRRRFGPRRLRPGRHHDRSLPG